MDERAQKSAALQAILEAWDKSLKAGVASELLASAAIYAALTDMVDLYGEEDVARFCDGLPERVRKGEFTLASKPQT